MLFIIHLTLNNRNISNQNVFLSSHIFYVVSYRMYQHSKCVQARRSHCLSSSSDLGAGSLYVFLSTTIQMVSRGFTSREFPSRSPFAIKFPNPSNTLSACATPFPLQDFRTFAGYISSHLFARNFDIVKLKFFFTFLSCKIITHILTGFQITFLTHLKKDGHTLLGLSSKVFTQTTCSLKSFTLQSTV